MIAVRLLSIAWIAVSCALAWGANDVAPQQPLRELAQNKSADDKPPKRSHPEREQEAILFVEQHHPELARLLAHLKKRDADSYDRAIRQLYRDARRLNELKERDAPRHSIELQKWQAESRIKLISARLSMGDNEQLRRKLQQELAARYDAKLALARLERNRMEKRAERAAKQVEQLEAGREQALERDLKKLLRQSGAKD